MRQVFVQPGEVHVATEPSQFRTVLGSCVAVCLWDEARHTGGLNHFVLPDARDGERDARFGDVAIPLLIDRLRQLGCANLVAKVFGGAAVMPASGTTVGDSNIAVALALLDQHHIAIVARRTGGTQGISLRFDSVTGAVRLRVFRPPS
jgi:chemotaxis protein CheD